MENNLNDNMINSKYICPLCRYSNTHYKILKNETDIESVIEGNTETNKIYKSELCIICQHNDSNILFINCSHNCICDKCIHNYIKITEKTIIDNNNINNRIINNNSYTTTQDIIYKLFIGNCLLYLFVFIPCGGIIILLLIKSFN